MSDDEAPKSAYELAMARLRQQDEQAGVQERALSDDQRARIAEIRKVAEAKLAEREILHRASLGRSGDDPAAAEELDRQYRRERDRIVSERDRQIDDVRENG